MSLGTNITLLCSGTDGEIAWDDDSGDHVKPADIIVGINRWMTAHNIIQLRSLGEFYSGGSRYGCAFGLGTSQWSPVAHEAFCAFFRTLPWTDPEEVVLIVSREEYGTVVIRPDGAEAMNDWRIRAQHFLAQATDGKAAKKIRTYLDAGGVWRREVLVGRMRGGVFAPDGDPVVTETDERYWSDALHIVE